MEVTRQDFDNLIDRFQFVFFSGQATAEDRFHLGEEVSQYLDLYMEAYPDFQKNMSDRQHFWWIACAAMDNASDYLKGEK